MGALSALATKCRCLRQLSLCRYFPTSMFHYAHLGIQCFSLVELDLWGNYFSDSLPNLPENLAQIRLSCNGTEQPNLLAERLNLLPNLASVGLTLACRDASQPRLEQCNMFLQQILSRIGPKVSALQIQLYQIYDHTLRVAASCCGERLASICIDAVVASPGQLQNLLLAFVGNDNRHNDANSSGGGGGLRCLKISRLRLTYKTQFKLARLASLLEELELSHMVGVDDRFLLVLARACRGRLRSLNLNGCRRITDVGLCALARRCPLLRELRLRATAVTDASLYALAQFCPRLEWIAHADWTRNPAFSERALQTLRDSCLHRVIC